LLWTLDIGARVTPTNGYAVTHTEIVESSHRTPFSRQDRT